RLAAASHIQADATQRANTLTAKIATIDGTLAALQQQHDSLDAQIQAQRQNLTLLMVDEYHDAGTPSIDHNDYTPADEQRDRKQHLGQAVADAQLAAITNLRTQMSSVDAQTVQQRFDRRDAVNGLNQAHADFANAQGAMSAARSEANATHAVLNRWLSIQGGASTPIMGRSVLSASELASWFVSSGRSARTTVSITTLAQDYINEGSAEGVRGDIAFAQSILETGSFGFPANGQLKSSDNNFAGIGACDSCANGYQFPDAQTGVRAQIQLLRNYADRSATAAGLTYAPVLPNFDSFYLQGAASTWNGLTGRWATAANYGDKIIGIYVQILSAATGIK
ncbi:MAG: Mannosyl-glycoprotein endo-beta-N-acetylglucosaminidase, partial [Actinomycetia bacterium]|nr:Mannosyl-glycoprotein endo-beta-N-acetylglucosaminidase [Actinomycetes bacterium]